MIRTTSNNFKIIFNLLKYFCSICKIYTNYFCYYFTLYAYILIFVCYIFKIFSIKYFESRKYNFYTIYAVFNTIFMKAVLLNNTYTLYLQNNKNL